MQSQNPVLRSTTFQQAPAVAPVRRGPAGTPSPIQQGDGAPDAMTVRGVISRSAILVLLVAFTFMWTWDQVMTSGGADGFGWTLLGGIGGLVLGIVISFRPKLAPWLAPPYALLEGMLLGGISAMYETGGGYTGGGGYDGIVFQAAIGTIAVFAAMLMLYRTRLVKVTARFRAVIMIAAVGIGIVYLLSFVMGMFGSRPPLIHESGVVGIGFSLFVVGIAALMLLVDFDTIERGVASGAPRYMEWYGAFALLVTLVWIYIELLRLLSKLRSR